MEVAIRPETPDDFQAIAEVNRLAFGGEDEVSLVAGLRDGGHVTLSLVAESGGEVIGYVMFSPLEVAVEDEGSIDAVSLAPLAVLPDHQRRGIGSKLTEAGLARCRSLGSEAAFVLGHPEYYPRFGFSAKLAANYPCAWPDAGDAWMAMELVTGSLEGRRGEVVFAAPFGAFE